MSFVTASLIYVILLESLCFSFELPVIQTWGISLCPTFWLYFRISEAFSLYSVQAFWVGEFSDKLYFKLPCLVEDTRPFLCLRSILHSYLSNKYTVLKTSTLAGWKKDNIRAVIQHLFNFISWQVCIEHCTRKVVFLFHKSTEYLQHDTILEIDNLGKQDN